MPCIRARSLGLMGFVIMLLSVSAPAQGIDDATEEQLRRLKKFCDDGLISSEICKEKQRELLGLRGPAGLPAPPGLSPARPPSAPAPVPLGLRPSARAAETPRSQLQPPQDFSVRLPPGWTEVTSEELKASREALQKQLAGNPHAHDLLKFLEASTSLKAGKYFRNDGDTLHINRSPNTLALNPDSAEKACQAVSDRLAAAGRAGGGQAPVLQDCGFRLVAGLPAIYVEQAGIHDETRVIQLWVGKSPEATFQFTLRCQAGHLATRRSELEEIIAAVRWQ